MRHPDPHAPPDRTPIDVGEVWLNPVTRERATILERTWDNPEGRATAELASSLRAEARAVPNYRMKEFFAQYTAQLAVTSHKPVGELRCAILSTQLYPTTI